MAHTRAIFIKEFNYFSLITGFSLQSPFPSLNTDKAASKSITNVSTVEFSSLFRLIFNPDSAPLGITNGYNTPPSFTVLFVPRTNLICFNVFDGSKPVDSAVSTPCKVNRLKTPVFVVNVIQSLSDRSSENFTLTSRMSTFTSWNGTGLSVNRRFKVVFLLSLLHEINPEAVANNAIAIINYFFSWF